MKFVIDKQAETASTNDDARTAAEKGAGEGVVFWALSQKSGRGRDGRQWHSPPGNLYFSVVLRPGASRQDYGQYSFVCALAIGDAVRSFLGDAKIELKWPNDVLVDDKKISGILLESGENFLIAGMGVNVGLTPENPLYPATSLKEQGADKEIEVVLREVLTRLSFWCEKLSQEGFEPIREVWLSRAKKGPMRVRLPRQNNEIQGHFSTLDTFGNLVLISSDGTSRTVAAGDIFF